jgi:pSer/pThr/pTyr-binding forkhead associated (FHA) protein
MPPELVALTDGHNILLDKPILLLGRHQECDIQLGSRKVSRRHCCLAQVEDYFVVRDLGSTNGIRINGNRVLEGSLRPGDELTIGNQRYQLQWSSQIMKAPPLPVPASNGPVPVTALGDSDDNLESCESPIPLPDRDQRVPIAAPLPVASPLPVNGFGTAHEPQSNILPDNLQMRPLSGEHK